MRNECSVVQNRVTWLARATCYVLLPKDAFWKARATRGREALSDAS